MKKKNGVKITQTAGYNGARTVYWIHNNLQKSELVKGFKDVFHLSVVFFISFWTYLDIKLIRVWETSKYIFDFEQFSKQIFNLISNTVHNFIMEAEKQQPANIRPNKFSIPKY